MSERPGLGEVVTRRVLPRAVVAESRVDALARLGAASRRRLGRHGRVELYFAFDDPSSAVALLDLTERLREYEAELLLLPVIDRGIPDDPAVELKRRYALTDARRLAERRGMTLARAEPWDPVAPGVVAEWVAGATQGPALTRFCVEAMRRLWFDTDGDGQPTGLGALWRLEMGDAPREHGGRHVRRNARRMRVRGMYDVPAAWVHGQWFFAHDRPVQIAERLDDLGWAPAG
jgi:2-hydroxychromene-2-carboxylate isomerase